MANPSGQASVTLDAFLGLVTCFAAESLPMGASPLNWDVDFQAGDVFTRAGLVSLYTFTPSGTSNLNFVKTLELTSGSLYTVALDNAGILWSANDSNLVSFLPVGSIITGSYMYSTTQDDVEYMCFSNLLSGTDIPRQYNPQPSIGLFTLDRISQVGPGAPPNFQPTLTLTAAAVTISSWTKSGNIITFQAVNTFTAGESVTLSGFATSTFFNGLTLAVLGTGLSGSQFQVSFSGATGGTDHGTATPQYGYQIKTITQNPSHNFNGQTILWSAGPGQVTAGQTITCYYGGPGQIQDLVLVNAFNNGSAVYVYIVGAPFGNGTQLVTGIGSGSPPSQSGSVPYFTFGATGSNYQISGNPPNSGGNDGSYQLTVATVTVSTPIPNVDPGDQVTVIDSSGSWNATWGIIETLNSGVYQITSTAMTNGTATYAWQYSGSAQAVAPTAGQLVTVIQTLNGNGIFNVIDGAIASVSGGPTSGTFTIASLGSASQTIPTVAETGQAQTSGTSFQIDPGQLTLGTTNDPIYGGASTGLVVIVGGNTAVGQGTRQAVVFFETRNGLKTQCSAPITFTTDSAATYLLASAVPIGPPNVIRRWIAFTSAGPNGIAGPNFYTIDAPVTYTINNQTYLYSATYIDDNISTSAKFTFTDAVLLAGEEIDVQGNNLFAQIELGSCAWNCAYAQRMFYGLEQNKVLNFTNLSFDGGYIPNPTGPNIPLGWGLDPASNFAAPAGVTITAYKLTHSSDPRFFPSTVTLNAVNNFINGQQFICSGLTVGTFLNGVVLTVASASPTQIIADYFTSITTGSVPDSGTAILVNESAGGASLIVSPVFGNALYLGNQTGRTQSVFGMLVQNAYQDAYNVPIILSNIIYSIRVACSNPSGNAAGSLIIDLTDSNAGQISGTQVVGGYGNTYGSFVLPLSEMTKTVAIYTGSLLTVPFTTGVSKNLLLRVWGQNLGYGSDILIDRIEVFPTATPLLATNIRVSYADNFEAFDSNTGNIGLAEHNNQPAYGAFEMHDQLYFLQSASMQSTQDVANVEPDAPGGGWDLKEVSNRVGACGIFAYDYGEEWVLTACRNGVYGFNGGQPIRIDFQQRELWELINWNAGQTIWLANDLPNSRILVGVPMATPNAWLPLAPVNANPASPNVVLMWNYQNLDTFEEIVSGRGVHTTMFGTLAAVDMRLKCSIWQITSPYAGFVTAADGLSQPLTICNGVANQKIYQMSPTQLSDDGAAINGTYFTFGFTDASKAKEQPLLGLHRKLYSLSQQDIYGSGLCTLTAYPNWIRDKNTLVFNPYAYSTPGGITLQSDPPDDIVRPLNVEGNRVFLSFSTNAVGAGFALSKLILVGISHPFSQVNPNSG